MNKSVLQDFLSLYERESTKKVYKWAMNKFLRFVADKHDLNSLDEYLALSMPVEDYQGDIRRFFVNISEIPPKSQATIEGVLRAFFNENHIGISNQWWKGERRYFTKGDNCLEEDPEYSTINDVSGVSLFNFLSDILFPRLGGD